MWEYESVDTVRGALSVLGIKLEGYRARNHPFPVFNRFTRVVFNMRPSFPRYAGAGDMWPMLQKL